MQSFDLVMVSDLKTLARASKQRIESVPSGQHIIFYRKSLKFFKMGPIFYKHRPANIAGTNTPPLGYSEPASCIISFQLVKPGSQFDARARDATLQIPAVLFPTHPCSTKVATLINTISIEPPQTANYTCTYVTGSEKRVNYAELNFDTLYLTDAVQCTDKVNYVVLDFKAMKYD